MQSLTQKILDSDFKDCVFNDHNYKTLVLGKEGAKNSLMHRSLKYKEIINLKKGLYLVNPNLSKANIIGYNIANCLVPMSYVSMESALSFHNWIPERVYLTTSVVSGYRYRYYNNYFGSFAFYNLPINKYKFMSGVVREEIAGTAFLIARPLRALIDMVCYKKLHWQGVGLLTDGYRIEEETLEELTTEDFLEVEYVYNIQRVKRFLKKLKLEICGRG